jgi:hypothetical protein
MLADLDLLLTAVFCTADDLLPERQKNARRRVTDAEVVTLCVAQAVMGISSDREFLAVASKRLGEMFPSLPEQPGFHKRRRRLTETIEWLIGVFAADCPGHSDPVLLLDSTPVECGRSVETVRRSELADACGYGYCRSHSRWSGACGCTSAARPTAPRGPLSWHPPTSPSARWRCACCRRPSMAASRSSATRAMPAASSPPRSRPVSPPRYCGRPARDEPDGSIHLAMIRQRIESVFWTLKDRLGLERHRARTLAGLRARIASKLLALAAGVWVNTLLGLPSRSFAQFAA